MLQMDDDEETATINSDPPDPNTSPSQDNSSHSEHHLSLNAMKGGTGTGTIRFTGTIGNIAVQILLDGGSSESFL